MVSKTNELSNIIDKSSELGKLYDSNKKSKSDEELKNFSIDAPKLFDSDLNLNTIYKPNQESAPKSDTNQKNIKVNYIGNKNKKEKGQYSEIPEVLNKNLIRSIRRYLNELYGPYNSKLSDSKFNEKKIMSVESFYEIHMKSQSQQASDLSKDDELKVLHFISVFLRLKTTININCSKHKNLSTNLNKLMKTYQSKIFRSIKSMQGFKQLLTIMREAGMIARMLESYPSLAKCKDSYEAQITSLIKSD